MALLGHPAYLQVLRCQLGDAQKSVSEANLVFQGVMLSLLGIKLRPEAVSGLLRHVEVRAHTLKVVVKFTTLTDIPLSLDQ